MRSANQIATSEGLKRYWRRRRAAEQAPKKARKKRSNPEQRLQMAVAGFLRVALRPPTIWTAFPAGGGGRVRGAFLKGMGLKAGWPDILIIHQGTGDDSIVLGIELKAGKNTASAQQEAVADSFERVNAAYEFCWTLEDVQHALKWAGIPFHARVSAALTGAKC